jgi:hypothetical protein
MYSGKIAEPPGGGGIRIRALHHVRIRGNARSPSPGPRNHSFDEHSRPRIHLEVFLKLAETDSPFFDQMIRMIYRVMVGEDTVKYYWLLLKLNRDKLITLIEILFNRIVLIATGQPLWLLQIEKKKRERDGRTRFEECR